MTDNPQGQGTGAVKPESRSPQNGHAPRLAETVVYGAYPGPAVARGDQARSGGLSGSPRMFLRAHLVEIVVITLVVTAAAAFFSTKQTKTYTSQAEVAVYPSNAASSTQQALDMGTEKLVASSGVVLTLASQSLGVPQSQLKSGLSVGVPVGANLLTISYSGRSPQGARRLAQGLADAYVKYRSLTLVPSASLQAVVITNATLPKSPASPKRILDVGVAVILGLALGFGTALVRDRIDDGIRGRQDLENQAGAEVLGVIPAFGRRRDHTTRLVMVTSPHSPVAEAYRNLRTRVVQAAGRRDANTLLVASPDGEEGGTTAANLAVALAQSGRRVVLVCADLREGSTEVHFGMQHELGLTSVVSGNLNLVSALRPTSVPGLQVLPAGLLSPDPGAVLQAPAFAELLTTLSGGLDFVVVSSSPMLASSDVDVLAELIEMVLFVADARRSTRAEVRGALGELDHVRDKVIGCVLANTGRRVQIKPTRPTPPAPGGNVEPVVHGPPAGAQASTTRTGR